MMGFFTLLGYIALFLIAVLLSLAIASLLANHPPVDLSGDPILGAPFLFYRTWDDFVREIGLDKATPVIFTQKPDGSFEVELFTYAGVRFNLAANQVEIQPKTFTIQEGHNEGTAVFTFTPEINQIRIYSHEEAHLALLEKFIVQVRILVQDNRQGI